MGPMKSDNDKELMTLTVITLRGFHCRCKPNFNVKIINCIQFINIEKSLHSLQMTCQWSFGLPIGCQLGQKTLPQVVRQYSLPVPSLAVTEEGRGPSCSSSSTSRLARDS